jgi:glycosyltransferase involved in cell wall biosynthesis
MLPLVTIAVPVFNGGPLLRRALEAVLAQDYENVEIIVSDNGSTDGSADVVREYLGRSPRMRLVVHPHNIGGSPNFQFLLREARGQYFFWAAADDRWTHNFVSRLVGELEAHPEAVLAFPAIERLRNDESRLDVLRFSGPLDPTALPHSRVAYRCAAGVPYHIALYGIWRIDYLRGVFHGLPQFLAGDRVFMCGVTLASRLRYVDEILYIRMTHAAPISERYAGEYIGAVYGSPARYFKAMFNAIPQLARFPGIPARRRLLIPVIGIRFCLLITKWMALAVIHVSLRRLLPDRVRIGLTTRVRRLFNS